MWDILGLNNLLNCSIVTVSIEGLRERMSLTDFSMIIRKRQELTLSQMNILEYIHIYIVVLHIRISNTHDNVRSSKEAESR
jgi:hypothetical protein